MEATEKSVSNVNGSFRKCGYPYCRNMAMATDDYCAMHQHSSLLVKNKNPKKAVDKTPPHKSYQCPKCEYHMIDPRGLAIHIGQKHKTAATLKQKLKAKKKAHAPDPPAKSEPLVHIILTPEEALETGIALALADKIDETRFVNSHNIAGKVLGALAELIVDEAHLEAR